MGKHTVKVSSFKAGAGGQTAVLTPLPRPAGRTLITPFYKKRYFAVCCTLIIYAGRARVKQKLVDRAYALGADPDALAAVLAEEGVHGRLIAWKFRFRHKGLDTAGKAAAVDPPRAFSPEQAL